MGIEFDQNRPPVYNYQQKQSGGSVTNLVIKMGLAKDEKGANTVMIIVTIVCFGLMIYIGF